MHEKKARFNHEFRSCDAVVIQRNQSPRPDTNGKNYEGGSKRIWTPVRRIKPKPVQNPDDLNAGNTLKVGEYQSAEDTIQNTKTSDVDGAQLPQLAESDAGHALKPEEAKIAEGGDGVNQQRRWFGMVQKDAIFEAKGTSLHDDLERNMGTRSEKREIRPGNNRTSGKYTDVYARGRGTFEAGGPSDHQRIFSAGELALMTSVRQYRPRKFEDSRSKSVTPGIGVR
jgi:hypothetical protein